MHADRPSVPSLRFLSFVLVALLLASRVLPGSSASAATLRVPTEFPTVTAAIEAAVDGDVVLVAPGVYEESIDFLGKAIVVESEEGAEVTTLRGGGTSAVVRLSRAEGNDSVLRGFTVTGGFGGGTGGGGIQVLYASPTIEANRIVGNSAGTNRASGILVFGAGPDGVAIFDNVITDNVSGTDPATGAALFLQEGAVRGRIEGNLIASNSGSGLRVDGDGFGEFAASALVVKRNRVEGNASTGVRIVNTSARLINNEILANGAEPTADGGGVFLFDGSFGTPPYVFEVKKNVVAGNRSSVNGGGMRISASSVVNNNRIHDNTAVLRGGGVAFEAAFGMSSQVAFSHNTVVGNHSDLIGGGMASDGRSYVTCTNSIFRGNTAPDPELEQIAFRGETRHSNVEGGIPGIGNIDADPLFVNAAAGDFRLRFGSPCVDAGEEGVEDAPPVDLEGDARSIDGDFDGVGLPDMGADELEPTHAVLYGAVGAATGSVFDVLFANGERGDGPRVVRVAAGGPFALTMQLPPGGGGGRYVVHANDGAPTLSTIRKLPAGLGRVAFPLFLSDGASPLAVFNNIGKEALVGESVYFDGSSIPDPPVAPAAVLDLPSGDLVNLPPGTVVTFQGAILDPETASRKPGSITNGVTVVFE